MGKNLANERKREVEIEKNALYIIEATLKNLRSNNYSLL